MNKNIKKEFGKSLVIREMTIEYKRTTLHEVSAAFTCAHDIYTFARKHWKELNTRETMVAYLLNNQNHVIGSYEVSKGDASQCEVNPSMVFRAAIISGAVRLVLVHNHPSGDPTPSGADIAVTIRLKKCGETLGVSVLDHIVICQGGYSSLADLNLMIE